MTIAVAIPHVMHDLKITSDPPLYSKATLCCRDSHNILQQAMIPFTSPPTCACMFATSTERGYRVKLMAMEVSVPEMKEETPGESPCASTTAHNGPFRPKYRELPNALRTVMGSKAL
ncbi:hypothetical protein EYF80_037723 [Liparis tanakae]|uniref:Uncharacterized protein n=1 Tax=Liparis tanakae TaxID=230148 RepID=A0A4Z2GGP7_9TELE|nr:hypothetical protein EYF80_037723 [Liparis tanakae]